MLAGSVLLSAGGLIFELQSMGTRLQAIENVVDEHTSTLVRLDAHMQLTTDLLNRRVAVSDRLEDRMNALEQRVSKLERDAQ